MVCNTGFLGRPEIADFAVLAAPKPLPTGGPLRGPPVERDLGPPGPPGPQTSVISGWSEPHVYKNLSVPLTQRRPFCQEASLVGWAHDIQKSSRAILSHGRNSYLSGSLAILNSDFWAGFRSMFGQTWPQNHSRTTGLVLQCRLHQTSAQQTNSKAISWQF